MDMDSNIDKESFRTYAWSYFALHSAQRMQCFQFYIALSTALIGGFAVLMKNDGLHRWHAAVWLAMTILSFIFWKLDVRTRQLVKVGESALKHLDCSQDLAPIAGKPHPLKLFDTDDQAVREMKSSLGWRAHMSYSRCFGFLFSLFGFGGMFLAIVCVLYGAS